MHLKLSKYFRRLYLLTFSACFCIIFFLICFTYFQMRDSLYHAELKKSEALFLRMKKYTEGLVQNLENTVYTIYESPSTKQIMYGANRDINDVVQYLNKINKDISFNTAVHSVYIYNKTEDTYYSTYKSMYYTDSDFESVKNGDYTDADFPLTRLTDDGWMLTYKLKDSYYTSKKDDSIYVNFKCDWIIHTILSGSEDPAVSLYVLNDKLESIAPENKETPALYLPENAKRLLSFAGTNDYGIFQMDTPDGKTYVSYAKLSRPGWLLIHITPSDVIFKSIEEWRRFVFILLLISVGAAVIFYTVISKILYSPINRIVRLLPSLPNSKDNDEFSLFERYVNSQKDELKRIKTDQDASSAQRKESAVWHLVSGNYIINEHFTQTLFAMHSFQVDFTKAYHVCVASLDDIENVFTDFVPETEKGLALFALQNITLECFQPVTCDYAYTENECMVLLFHSPGSPDEISGIIHRVQENISKILHTGVSFSVSEPLTGISEAPSAYKRCQELLQNKFFTGRNSIFMEPFTLPAKNHFSNYNNKYENKILEIVEKRRNTKLNAHELTYITGFVSELAQMDYTSVYMILILFTDSLKKLCLTDKEHSTDPIDIERITDMLNPKKIRFLCDLPSILENSILILNHRQTDMLQVQAQFVEKSLRYIKDHFGEYDLCATVLAEYVGISSPYLGKLFKQQTGKSIPEYINEIRLDNAARWLRSLDLTVQDAAIRAGYQNCTYFFKVFKIRYGMTPKGYQEQYSIASSTKTGKKTESKTAAP